MNDANLMDLGQRAKGLAHQSQRLRRGNVPVLIQLPGRHFFAIPEDNRPCSGINADNRRGNLEWLDGFQKRVLLLES